MPIILLHCMCREWAEIAGELHRRGLFWIVADIIAELVPTGRAAVEAHKAIYDYLSPDHVCPYTLTAVVAHLPVFRMNVLIWCSPRMAVRALDRP